MTNSTRPGARLLLGLIGAAGAVLLVLLLAKGDVDALAARTTYSALAVIVVSLALAAGLRLARQRTPAALLGAITVVIALTTLVLLAHQIWSDNTFGDFRRSYLAILLTLGLGFSSLLLGSERDEDTDALRLIRRATVAALAILVLLVILTIVDVHISGRPIGIAAALFLIGALSLPVLRFADPSAGPAKGLAVDHVGIAVSDCNRSDRFYTEVLGAPVDTEAEGHVCFVWPGRTEAAMEHLRRAGIPLVEGPVARTGAGGAGVSIYCRDPDGSLVELISYS